MGAAALILLSCGCRGAARDALIDPDTVQPVVTKLPGRGGADDPDAASRAAQAEAALQSAEAAWRSGDALTALAIVNRALAQGVPPETESALRGLRAKARSSVVVTKVCRVRAIPDKDAVADGTAVPLRIEFANLSTATLSVPRAQKGTSDTLVILTLTRADYDVWGNERSSNYTLPVQVKEDLVLDPGCTHEVRLTIPAEMAKLSHQGFSVLELSGTFRPVVMRVGQTEFFDAIPIGKATVRVFLAGFEPLALDPLGSLKKAVAKRSPPHILTCAELLSPADRAEARAFLEAAKAKDGELAQVIDASLARLRSAGTSPRE
jgi:hypothetical protein